MRKTFILLAFFGILSFIACNKEKDMRTATVINTGDISYEGCGYILELDNGELLKPNYLPGAYQHGGIKVNILYEHTGLLDTCKFGIVLYDLINLKEIEMAY